MRDMSISNSEVVLMNVILSIRPRYADAIMRGEKKYEYRRSLFKRKNVSRAFIYATSPVKRIIGCFSIRHLRIVVNILCTLLSKFRCICSASFFSHWSLHFGLV